MKPLDNTESEASYLYNKKNIVCHKRKWFRWWKKYLHRRRRRIWTMEKEESE